MQETEKWKHSKSKTRYLVKVLESSRLLSGVIAIENGPLNGVVKDGYNENVMQHADHLWEGTLDKLTDNEPATVTWNVWMMKWRMIVIFQVTLYQ